MSSIIPTAAPPGHPTACRCSRLPGAEEVFGDAPVQPGSILGAGDAAQHVLDEREQQLTVADEHLGGVVGRVTVFGPGRWFGHEWGLLSRSRSQSGRRTRSVTSGAAAGPTGFAGPYERTGCPKGQRRLPLTGGVRAGRGSDTS
ncbi:hypothetical protein [Streptomyces sp. NPDC088246]|uniref:hypothetical protein n=1 Tax=Streptomyces sp. NPDC088246 TaxID=3365842 RepID=UPI00381694AE